MGKTEKLWRFHRVVWLFLGSSITDNAQSAPLGYRVEQGRFCGHFTSVRSGGFQIHLLQCDSVLVGPSCL